MVNSDEVDIYLSYGIILLNLDIVVTNNFKHPVTILNALGLVLTTDRVSLVAHVVQLQL